MKLLHTYFIGCTDSGWVLSPRTKVVALSDLCYLPRSSDHQKGQSDQKERLIAVRRVMPMKDDTSHKALDFSCKIFVKAYLYAHLCEHDTSVYHVFN